MNVVLRAYDRATVLRAESLSVAKLWTLLESGGLWDQARVRAGLNEKPDVFARETVVSRLESLVQEGYGDASLYQLRGGEAPTLVSLRRAHWPVIKEDEAVQLREDLIRYLTYGLWQAPEELVARSLSVLTGQSDASFLLGGNAATGSLQAVLEIVEDDRAFAERYSQSVRSALRLAGKLADDEAVEHELRSLGQLLGPVHRLLRGAEQAGLQMIAYQDRAGGDGLTTYIAQTMQSDAGSLTSDVGGEGVAFRYDEPEHSNGHGDSGNQH